MVGLMQVAPREPDPLRGSFAELPPRVRLPKLDLAVEWESPGREFRSSVHDFFAGPKPPTDSELEESRVLRIDWVRGRLPGRALMASSLWHVIAIWLLVLPIWGFLPDVKPTLVPVQIEVPIYFTAEDLRPISLPAATHKPSPPRKKPDETVKPEPERGADAYHPRQTILSIPVRVTHPRQTLIQPEAPADPPKIVPPLPNIVQWTPVSLPRPKIRFSPVAAKPRVQQRAVQDAAVPEVANLEKTQGQLNIASEQNARPQMLVSPTSAPIARQQRHEDSAAAPEIGATADDASLHRLIALSATPAPPSPEVNVPEGNLAARISISPAGTQPGNPSGAEHGASGAGEGGGSPGATSAANGNAAGGAGVGASSLPAAVSVSSGGLRAGGGGVQPAGSHRGMLILKPVTPTEPSSAPTRGAANVAGFSPYLPPEKLLSGKEVYTLHIDMPNLTSAVGSWIISFAQLDEDERPPFRRRGQLSGPVPIEKADPKYPPEMIKAHVQGEVVLYAIIRKDGSVDSIQIVRGLEPELDRNSMDALAHWKFRPGTREGAPVDLEAVVRIPFQYRDPRDYSVR
jgi:TonB family protein